LSATVGGAMPSHVLIGLDDEGAWRSALEAVPHGFAHTWDACRAVHATTGLDTYLYVYRAEGLTVTCPIVERPWKDRVDIATPFGFSGFCSNEEPGDFLSQFRKFCARRGYICGYIALHPTLSHPALHGGVHVSNTLFVMDLRCGHEHLFARINRERRRVIRSWKESGRTFVTDREAITEFIVNRYPPFMRFVGAGAAAEFSAETLRRLCASRGVEMLGVEDGGEVVAIHAWASTRWDAECLFFLARPCGRKYMPVLTWAAIERCADLGLPSLNLGGGRTPDDSIAFAKKLLRPREVPLRSIRDVYDREAYASACRKAGVPHNPSAGFFPAYRGAGR